MRQILRDQYPRQRIIVDDETDDDGNPRIGEKKRVILGIEWPSKT